MSADNGVYLLQTKDGWRITHAQAIDNLYWWHVPGSNIDHYEQRTEVNPAVLFSYFKNSVVYKDHTEAWHNAVIEYRKHKFVEYGLQYIRGLENMEFPKQCCDKPDIKPILDGDADYKRCLNCGEFYEI